MQPTLVEVVAVWHMAFGEPPVLKTDVDLLLHVLRRHFPDVLAILADERCSRAA